MSWITNYGYRLIEIRVDGKRKLVLEHRYLMEQHLGRKLDTKEHVHHINGDKLDNRLENLEVMTIAEHNRHHFTGVVPKGLPAVPWNKGRTMVICWCEVCGAVIQRTLRKVNSNKKQKRKNVCSPHCRAVLGRQTQLQ